MPGCCCASSIRTRLPDPSRAESLPRAGPARWAKAEPSPTCPPRCKEDLGSPHSVPGGSDLPLPPGRVPQLCRSCLSTPADFTAPHTRPIVSRCADKDVALRTTQLGAHARPQIGRRRRNSQHPDQPCQHPPGAGCPRVPVPAGSQPAALDAGIQRTPCFVLVPLLFAARSDGPEPICVSSPLWVAAFRLAAVSIAAGEAAPVASCSIPATGRERGRDGRGESSPD